MTRGVARLVLLAGVAVGLTSASACGNGSTTPTTPSFTENDQVFPGTINPLGTSVQQFAVAYAGNSDASVTITSLTKVSDGTPVSITLGVGFGSLNVGNCTLVSSLTNPTAPLNTELPTQGAPFAGPSTYCVELFDNPNAPTVPQPLNYSITVKHF